jgi:hypothetical protein
MVGSSAFHVTRQPITVRSSAFPVTQRLGDANGSADMLTRRLGTGGSSAFHVTRRSGDVFRTNLDQQRLQNLYGARLRRALETLGDSGKLRPG